MTPVGLPSHQGVITLFDERDGALLCVMDAEHITAMRTGGAAAISVRALARRREDAGDPRRRRAGTRAPGDGAAGA